MNEVKDLLIGLMIGGKESQIAVYNRKMRDAECISTKAGTDLYAFPTVLLKMFGRDEWHFGREAEYFAGRGEGELLPDLYRIFSSEKTVTVDHTVFEPWQLLMVYVRETLGLLGVNDVLRVIRGIMITTPKLGRMFARNVSRAMEVLMGGTDRFSVQDGKESFYYYCLYEMNDTLRRPMCLMTLDGDTAGLHFLRTENAGSLLCASVRSAPRTMILRDGTSEDAQLLKYVSEELHDGSCAAVFITGGPFDRERYPQTTGYILRDRRRVFAGDNLFVKGACFAAYEKTEAGRFRSALYLGEDLVRCNISILLTEKGEVTSLPLVKAGTNWFENAAAFEMIPEENHLVFTLVSMDGARKEKIRMDLPDLPDRPYHATRLKVQVQCVSHDECTVIVEDLGFGSLYRSEGISFRKTILLTRPNESGTEEEKSCGMLLTTPRAEVPFPVYSIGAELFSLEELCFFYKTYPELIDSDTVNESLPDWFEKELHLSGLARTTRKALNGEELKAFLLPIFEEAGYLSSTELTTFESSIEALTKESSAVRLRKKGDALAGYGKLISALTAYRKALTFLEKEEKPDPKESSDLYHRMGCAYMHMLLYQEALECFKLAYLKYHTMEAHKTYLTAAAIAKPRSQYEQILKTIRVQDKLRDEIDADIRDAMEMQEVLVLKEKEVILQEYTEAYRKAAGIPQYENAKRV